MSNTTEVLVDEKAKIKELYQSGLKYVNESLIADENNNEQKAISCYIKALELLQNGLILCTIYQNNLQDIQDMKTHMEVFLANVQERLYALNNKTAKSSTAAAPDYSENVPEGHTSIQSMPIENDCYMKYAGAVELLKVMEGVHMYFVSSAEQVSTMPPSYPTSVRILWIENEAISGASTNSATSEMPPKIMLQVGGPNGWSYELKTQESPVLKTENGTYMFPCNDTKNYIAVGIIFSSDVPHECIEMFDNILLNLAVFEIKPQEVDESMSGKIAFGLKKGAEYVGYGLSKGAEASNYLINKGSEKLQNNITPSDNPVKVNPNVETGLHYTKKATEATVKVSKFLVDGLYTLTSKAGTFIAPYAKQAGDKIFPQSENEKSNGNIEATAKVLEAGMIAFGTIWNDLERAGMAIAKSVSSATVDTVQLKYGTEAGNATSQAMDSGLNLGKTAFNINHLGIKAIMKRAAKDTGAAVVREYNVPEDKNGKVEEKNYTKK